MILRRPMPASLSAILLMMVLSAPAYAGWTWLHPKPQGHNLYDVKFLTDTAAIAVGEAATVMVTNDAGTTWSVSAMTNGLTGVQRSVAAIDANTAVVVGDGNVVLRTIDGGITWTQQPGGTFGSPRRVDFVGSVGLAVGSTGISRSTDGGLTWSTVQTGTAVQDVDMVTPTLAFIASVPGVLQSTDGGQTWQNTGFTDYLIGEPRIAFADPLKGVVYSGFGGYGSGSYYFTADGGQTWDHRYGPMTGSHDGTSANEIVMLDAQTLFVAGSGGGCDAAYNCFSYGPLLRTVDGAASWDGVSAPRPLLGLDRNGDGIILAVGEVGNIWRWVPPTSWQRFGGTQYDDHSYGGAMSFVNPSTGIVSGCNFIYGGGPTETLTLRTSDAGSNWSGKTLYATVINDFAHARGPNPAVYGVGRVQINGVFYTGVFKSTNDGATWPLLWSETPYTWLWAIDFADATHGVAVGNNGRFVVLDNDVVTAGTISGGGQLSGVAFADASVAVAIGSNGLFRTADGGATWSNVPSPAGARTEIGFASATVGVAVGANGSVLRTDDGGLTWQSVPSPTTNPLYKVSFASSTYGMIAGGGGTLLETDDGGQTWTALPSAPTPGPLLDLACFGPRRTYVLTWDLRVLEYRENTVPTLFSSFDARPRGFAADLSWSVQDESNLQGFRVVRDAVSLSTLGNDVRTYRDESVRPGANYEYVLFALGRDGSETRSFPVRVTIPTAAVELLPNQPNPFNPTTTLRFVVPEKAWVRLTVHDVAGRIVATLVDGTRDTGLHSVSWHADGMASGVYFARLRAGKVEVSRKLVLLK